MFTKNDVTMYWREMIFGENWLHSSSLCLEGCKDIAGECILFI